MAISTHTCYPNIYHRVLYPRIRSYGRVRLVLATLDPSNFSELYPPVRVRAGVCVGGSILRSSNLSIFELFFSPRSSFPRRKLVPVRLLTLSASCGVCACPRQCEFVSQYGCDKYPCVVFFLYICACDYPARREGGTEHCVCVHKNRTE